MNSKKVQGIFVVLYTSYIWNILFYLIQSRISFCLIKNCGLREKTGPWQIVNRSLVICHKIFALFSNIVKQTSALIF